MMRREPTSVQSRRHWEEEEVENHVLYFVAAVPMTLKERPAAYYILLLQKPAHARPSGLRLPSLLSRDELFLKKNDRNRLILS